MMRKEFFKKKGFRKPNFKRDENDPLNCFECKKSEYIKKDYSMLKDNPKNH